MSEWWTYELSDFLLFSPQTYYRLFEIYNLAIWPAHILAIGLGLIILAAWLYGRMRHGRIVPAILAACWLWVAWAYFLQRYESINWAATYYAMGFAIEALLLIWVGFVRKRLVLRPATDATSRCGLALFCFALVVVPLIGPLLGRGWTQAEVFAVAPDPTALATLGVLLAADRPAWILYGFPLVWCAISGATLWTMRSPDALLLPAAAIFAALAVWKSRARLGDHMKTNR